MAGVPGSVDASSHPPEGPTPSRGSGRRVPPEWVSSRPRAPRARRVADTLRERIAAGSFADGVIADEATLARAARGVSQRRPGGAEPAA